MDVEIQSLREAGMRKSMSKWQRGIIGMGKVPDGTGSPLGGLSSYSGLLGKVHLLFVGSLTIKLHS